MESIWVVGYTIGCSPEEFVYLNTEDEAKSHLEELVNEKVLRLKSPWVEVSVERNENGVKVSKRTPGIFINGYFLQEASYRCFEVKKGVMISPRSSTIPPGLPPRKNVFEEDVIVGNAAVISEYFPDANNEVEKYVISESSKSEYITPSRTNIHTRTEFDPEESYVVKALTKEPDVPKRSYSGVNAYTWI